LSNPDCAAIEWERRAKSKPAELPLQAPAKYELAINLAKTLALTVPPTVLSRPTR
jgi:hypothetical protein